ncbi:dihydrofolate reductase [Desulfosporosinus shakirovi]|uniref:dihydrofolate reductase n=1 Tax=Desulfosporosinus shakirovi TaxID=2885154 RepID=UPI001E364A9E|nr:dihydrofolate reductase [Desulfosporosinus sp. SRJS8]MCB8815650.1 dihydrofolate reductase [Desulfosporosinus sp. SRJS8]
MKAIAAVDLNWGIGYRGNLLKRIPDDMKFFKQMTLGKVVIMGRETFESLPGQEPLKDRVNIVLSKSERFDNERVILCRSLDELYSELEKYDTDDVFVVGGESVYSQLLASCTEAYVTKIEEKYVADKYFVNLDKNKAWKLVSATNLQNHENIGYKFVKYALVG